MSHLHYLSSQAIKDQSNERIRPLLPCTTKSASTAKVTPSHTLRLTVSALSIISRSADAQEGVAGCPEAHNHRWIAMSIIGSSAIAPSVHVRASARPTFLRILTFQRCLFFVIPYFHWPVLMVTDTTQQFTNDGDADANGRETTRNDLFLEPTTPMNVDGGSINIKWLDLVALWT